MAGKLNYLDPTVISNLTLATNENPKSWLTYGAVAGIGVPSSYDGWFTYITKIRAEINYNPNTNQSQVLKVKWADNQEITSATIGLSALLPKSSSAVDDQGNEAGLLQLFKDGAPVSASNFTINRLNAPANGSKTDHCVFKCSDFHWRSHRWQFHIPDSRRLSHRRYF
jgi:hypothetical protein